MGVVVKVSHVHDICDLFSPIANAQLAFLQFFYHLLLSVRILCSKIMHVFHEALHVTKSEQLRDERLRCELVEIM